jgi:hypothetical protein
MKKLIIIAVVLLFTTMAFASGGRPKKPSNWDIFGSDDRQNNHTEIVQPLDPTTPVKVVEPLTGYLLAVGLVGLAAWARRR